MVYGTTLGGMALLFVLLWPGGMGLHLWPGGMGLHLWPGGMGLHLWPGGMARAGRNSGGGGRNSGNSRSSRKMSYCSKTFASGHLSIT